MEETEDNANPILKRLDDQITWYDKKSNLNQRRFKTLKISLRLSPGLSSHLHPALAPRPTSRVHWGY